LIRLLLIFFSLCSFRVSICCWFYCFVFFFFFNDTATTEIYTLSLHDALPISPRRTDLSELKIAICNLQWVFERSEEHTSELQSRQYLVCRLLLEKKKK